MRFELVVGGRMGVVLMHLHPITLFSFVNGGKRYLVPMCVCEVGS